MIADNLLKHNNLALLYYLKFCATVPLCLKPLSDLVLFSVKVEQSFSYLTLTQQNNVENLTILVTCIYKPAQTKRTKYIYFQQR